MISIYQYASSTSLLRKDVHSHKVYVELSNYVLAIGIIVNWILLFNNEQELFSVVDTERFLAYSLM